AERNRKATNRPGADVEQYRCRDERGDVRIQNCCERATEPCIDSVNRSTATTHFFSDAFVYQHVGIDGDADGKHDTGYSWQRQLRVEEGQYAENQRDVDSHGDVRE